jgi:hypothetical protein
MTETFRHSRVLSDTLIVRGSGMVHSIVFSQDDAAPTAGSVVLYDNFTNSGTVLFKHTFTTAAFMPTSIILDVAFANGLYADFTTTADVAMDVQFESMK